MPGIRPFTRRQARENAAFLDQLRRTGNARLAARALGAHRAKFTKRRNKHAAFAAQWEMALAACHAAMQLGGGPRPPEGRRDALRTQGGEPTIVRLKSGRLQLRLAPPGRMTKAAEQLFFRALAASANVRLSAAATGFAAATFYARRRTWPYFAGEMKLALRIGYDRLECVAMERTLQTLYGGGADNGWLDHAIVGNPLPRLSFDQAFQQLCLHRDTVRLDGERPPGRRAHMPRNPEAALFALSRNIDAIERAAHYEATGAWRLPNEPAPPPLPPLELVTGWSKAAPVKVVHNPRLALFGGWRIPEMTRKMQG